MAGKVQHEIPRLYQRGFLIRGTGEAERIFVFRKDRSYPSNIDRAGAESNFYSTPSEDGSRTLDDDVTDYEGDLSTLVRVLRSTPIGVRVEGRVAGEVIAHLTTRNAHLRGAFAHGFRTMARGVVDVLGDEDNVRRLIGIETPWISDRFRERFVGVVTSNPHVAALGIDPALLERMIFASVREGFSPLFQTQIPAFTSFAGLIAEHADEQVRDAHNEALRKTFAPEPRIEDLASFTWQKLETESDLILPDCVAVALETDGSVHPLMMADLDRTNAVLLPLTSRTLLTGTRTEEVFDPATFNEAAASCSHRYFLAASHTPMMVELSNSIGARSVIVVETAIGESLAEFASGSPKPAEVLSSGMSKQPLIIPVSFTGDFDAPIMESIADRLRALLGELAWTIPLDRLEGISFADDYPAALAALDRGIPDVKQPETRQDNVGVGIGQAPIVFRNDVPKCHVVVVSHVGRSLAAENEDDRVWASAVLASLVAQAGILQIVDETLPGVMLSRRCQDMEADLQGCSSRGWNAYFSSRASAGFDERRLSDAQDIMRVALLDVFTEIPKARLDYRFHGEERKLFDFILPKIGFLLEHAANVAGVADGTGQDPLDGAAELSDLLASNSLLAWFSDYRRDLIYLWDRRRRWDSYDEFLALNRHAERLLWCFAIIPWMTPDGQYRVEIPLQTDQEALAALEVSQTTPR